MSPSTILLPFLLLALLAPLPCLAARDYTPVDQLGRGSSPAQRLPRAPVANKSRNFTSASPAFEARSFRTESGAIKLFGTVEFRRPLDTLPGWLDVIERNMAEPIFIAHKQFNRTTSWDGFQNSVRGKSPMEQLRFVNSFWNGWPYREDIANWGTQDYWEIPAQFLKKSGDCEDYAIVKYFTLKELGFDPQKMRIVVLRDTIRNLAHAVLVVFMDDDAYVLDNLSNVVMSHRRLGNYSPQYSVNEFGRWAHIKGKKKL